MFVSSVMMIASRTTCWLSRSGRSRSGASRKIARIGISRKARATKRQAVRRMPNAALLTAACGAIYVSFGTPKPNARSCLRPAGPSTLRMNVFAAAVSTPSRLTTHMP